MPRTVPQGGSFEYLREQAQRYAFSATVVQGGGGPAPTYLPTLSSTTYANVSGLHKLVAGYSGPLATVCASNAANTPASTIDVYPNADGTPDLTAAVAAYGASFDVYKTYDQTGVHAANIQVAAASRLTISATKYGAFAGMFGGKVLFNSAGSRNWLARPSTVSVNTRDVAYMAILAGAGMGNSGNVLFNLGSEDFLTGLTVYQNSQGWRNDGSTAYNLQLSVDMNPCVVGIRSSGTGQIYYRNEQTKTTGLHAASTVTGGNIGNFGNFGFGQGESSNLFRFGDIVFSTNPSDADWLAVQTAMKARFSIPVRTSQVIDTGDSITAGLGQASTPTVSGRPRSYYERGRLTRDPLILNMGAGGSKATDWATTLSAAVFTGLYQSGFVRNVFRHNSGRNDLATTGTTADVITSWTTIIGRAQAAGFLVSMRTLLPSASMSEPNRTTVNTWLRTNAAGMGFVVEDMDTIAAAPSWADGGIHPDDITYSRMADVAVPIVNGLLA